MGSVIGTCVLVALQTTVTLDQVFTLYVLDLLTGPVRVNNRRSLNCLLC